MYPDLCEHLLEISKSLEGFIVREFRHESSSASAAPTAIATTPVDDDKDIAGRVTVVKAIFPDYGKAFILASLKAFDMDVERTTDALLTGNIPPHLDRLDRFIPSHSTFAIIIENVIRTAELVTIGKSSLQVAFSEESNKSFLKLQKAKIR